MTNHRDDREDDLPEDDLPWIRQTYAMTPGPDAAARAAAIDVIVRQVPLGDTLGNTYATALHERAGERRTRWRWGIGGIVAAAIAIVFALGWERNEPATQAPHAIVTHTPRDTHVATTPSTTLQDTSKAIRLASRDTGGRALRDSAIRIREPHLTPAPSLATTHPGQPSDAPLSPPAPPASLEGASALLAALDSASASAIRGIFDSAATLGIPTKALVSRLREGVRRSAPGPRIVVVVRNYASALGTAKTALGQQATTTEIETGAEALLAGASADALRAIRNARPAGPVAEALATLTDLSSRGVAPRGASQAIAALAARSRSDDAIRALRADVVGSIVRGVAPDAALANVIRRTPSAPAVSTPAAPTPRLETRPDSTPLVRPAP